MRKRTLFYSHEAEIPIDENNNTDKPTDENPDETPSENPGENGNSSDAGGDMEDVNLSNTEDDMEEEDKNFDPGPLNVDLVYRLKELEINNKTNTEEYSVLKKLSEKRQEDEESESDEEGNQPVALEIQASQLLKDDSEKDGNDLLEDESVSKPNDYDDEQYTRFESTDMSIEHFRNCLAMEVRYSNDANDYMLNNIKDTAKNVGSGVVGVAKTVTPYAGTAVRGGANLVGKAANIGGRTAAGLIATGYASIKTSIVALDKFYERHEANFASLEKQLGELRKNIYLMKDIDNRKPYTNEKVIRNIVTEKDTNLRDLLTHQIQFYTVFSQIVISSLKNQADIMEDILESATSKELTQITLKNLTSKRLITGISERASIESVDGPNSHLVEIYQSKNVLMGNRVLLSMLPSSSITTIEDYIEAMRLSKVSVYKLNANVPSGLKVPNKHELLGIVDLAIELTRHLRNTKSEFNKIIGIKKLLLSAYKHFDIISTTEYFLSTDKNTRKEISQYLKVSSTFMDHIYVDPFINVKNYYFNALKYLTHYLRDILKR